jgi:SPP1 family predicted phage head-tail adaptor
MINAGKYNRKITIIQEYVEKDADGFAEVTAQIVLQPWAEVKTTKGMTLIANGSDFEKAFTRFTFRFPENTVITRKMFVLFKGKKYSIQYINDINEENIELELQCKEVTH